MNRLLTDVGGAIFLLQAIVWRQEDGRELQFIGVSLFLLLQQGARNPTPRYVVYTFLSRASVFFSFMYPEVIEGLHGDGSRVRFEGRHASVTSVSKAYHSVSQKLGICCNAAGDFLFRCWT
jgi:hypothetical protein